MLVATLALFLAQPQLQGEDAINALRQAAIPIASVDPTRDDKDLLFLKDALGKATIVGLGEATHGSREIFRMKHRLFRFLVERMGVTVLLMESSMPSTIAMDEYVAQGKGDPVSATRNQGFWTWSTEEVCDLLKWMRMYNLDPKHKKKLRVLGIDMQNNWDIETYLVQAFKDAGLREYPKLNDPSWKYEWQEKHEQKEPVEVAYDSSPLLQEIRKAMDQAVPALQAKFGKERVAMAEHMVELYRQHTDVIRLEYLREDLDGARATITPDAAVAAVEQAKKLLQTKDLAPNVRWGLEIAAGQGRSVAEVTPKKLRAAALEIEGAFPKETVLASVLRYAALAMEISHLPLIPRDPFMADNIVWAITKYLPGQKAAIWAHNSHVGMSDMQGKPLMMGAHLNRRLGAKYYPLGFAFREGGFRATDGASVMEFTVGPAKQGSFDDLLALVRQPAFFLDLDRAKPELKTWLQEPRPWRNVGSTYRVESPDAYYETLPVGKLFRGLIYLEKLTPARPLTR